MIIERNASILRARRFYRTGIMNYDYLSRVRCLSLILQGKMGYPKQIFLRVSCLCLSFTYLYYQSLKASAAACSGWLVGRAMLCYVIAKNDIQKYTSNDSGLDPFAPLRLFFTSQTTSLHPAPRSTDPTMNILYRVSPDVYTATLNQDTQFVNKLKQLNDIYCEQYEKKIQVF
ncbi:hypothetical protein PHYBLDRAFT_161351 [Phycomyces blakesleeanus NRRL 1555(-)]|uniref:Uncharacterized protein n=1 Tax=Phycomyces blakesleeanus (strain ATCC 8743b / DSM 1359 / FGSC 10004 / NBRC 33097 / NRRL 1555) TaxID=763407 RepID=A0A163EPT9_PHYB8|nr:hypothetical protein PHYBLDRAFT_161351 [Phycomyces blakesleeanus NRRL 1555(-)]OAD80710.1 hypothetical protein PHYBLDRAFT_161351 [Phycomyces blakesleeanus NRRL 1555(-)]|eukprot:XP_018298750.1 hypothetical protein PHYBLDRAFT_161351 [Phycomyces blakesleeanus NRRL 1555(-)]